MMLPANLEAIHHPSCIANRRMFPFNGNVWMSRITWPTRRSSRWRTGLGRNPFSETCRLFRTNLFLCFLCEGLGVPEAACCSRTEDAMWKNGIGYKWPFVNWTTGSSWCLACELAGGWGGIGVRVGESRTSGADTRVMFFARACFYLRSSELFDNNEPLDCVLLSACVPSAFSPLPR